jgi:hypothetical protein
MIGEDLFQLALNVWVAWAGKFLADRSEILIGFHPAFAFSDFQDVHEIALDGGFDSLVSLEVTKVPDAESHEGERGESEGKLQFEEHPRVVRQSPLLEHP